MDKISSTACASSSTLLVEAKSADVARRTFYSSLFLTPPPFSIRRTQDSGREVKGIFPESDTDTNRWIHRDAPGQRREFVGDSVEVASTGFLTVSRFCSDTTHVNTSSQIFATDSIVSSSTSSSLCSSSKRSLAAEPKKEEKKKIRHKPLFKKRLKINLNDVQHNVQHNEFGSHTESNAKNEKNGRCDKLQKTCEIPGIQLSVEQLLSLTKQRTLEAQSKLTLSQLKQQARSKARANSKPSRQPRNKKNGRCSKPKSAAADLAAMHEPLEKIEMYTGILYLYRGENRTAKFVRRK